MTSIIGKTTINNFHIHIQIHIHIHLHLHLHLQSRGEYTQQSCLYSTVCTVCTVQYGTVQSVHSSVQSVQSALHVSPPPASPRPPPRPPSPPRPPPRPLSLSALTTYRIASLCTAPFCTDSTGLDGTGNPFPPPLARSALFSPLAPHRPHPPRPIPSPTLFRALPCAATQLGGSAVCGSPHAFSTGLSECTGLWYGAVPSVLETGDWRLETGPPAQSCPALSCPVLSSTVP